MTTPKATTGAAAGGPLWWSRQWTVYLLLCLLSSACSQRNRGEFDPVACSDELDNDDDGKTDCDDPDCRGLRICAPTSQLEQDLDRAPLVARDATVGVSSFSSIPLEVAFGDAGSSSDPTLEADEDGGTDDAATQPDNCGEQLCSSAERCVSDTCVAIDAGPPEPQPNLAVAAASAILGRQTFDGQCIDDMCGQLQLLYCACDPDPYVQIVLNGKVIKTTMTYQDTLTPIWDEAAVELVYHPGDVLEAVLLDDDSTESDGTDDVVFSCILDPPELASVRYSCAGPDKLDLKPSTLEIFMQAL